jgi:predicted NAD/FAD-dependent oxidoreductase
LTPDDLVLGADIADDVDALDVDALTRFDFEDDVDRAGFFVTAHTWTDIDKGVALCAGSQCQRIDALVDEFGVVLLAVAETNPAAQFAFLNVLQLRIEFDFADRFFPDVYRRGRRHPFKRFISGRTGNDIGRFRVRVASMRPSPALDARSAAWLMRDLGLSDRARFLIGHELREAYGVEPEYLSLLFYIQQSRVSRDAATLFRIRGGADLLPLALARGLDVRLEEPASHVERSARGVSVDGIDADFCVVTVPVPVLASMEFEPELPPILTTALDVLAYGHGVKSALEYARRPTRGVVADLTFQWAWEVDRRLVTAYTTGRNGILLGSVSRRTRPLLVADELEEIYPGSRADYERGETVSWHTDGWSQGTAVAYAPGQVNRFQAALRRPLGRLHFAGEHTDAFAGTMEGAVRSGRRVAKTIARG